MEINKFIEQHGLHPAIKFTKNLIYKHFGPVEVDIFMNEIVPIVEVDAYVHANDAFSYYISGWFLGILYEGPCFL